MPLTMTHWGAYDVDTTSTGGLSVRPAADDPDPSPIGRSLADAIVSPLRVRRPAVRAGWLDGRRSGGPSGRRGAEPFVEVSWDEALDLVAVEHVRVRDGHGPAAIYGGSYGWASAGRFHHALSQLHRFLALAGGYVRCVDTHSHAAAEVIVPRVLGLPYKAIQDGATSWPVIARHTDLMVCFGGLPTRTSQISSGGVGRHGLREWLGKAGQRTRFVSISPIADDLDGVPVDWLPARPNTDAAILLGLAHTLTVEGLADEAFLARYTVGWPVLRDYLTGAADGQPKDADWAGAIAGLPGERLRGLARRMAAGRTLITATWSVQRADHGEQPYWLVIALAAMLGQIGLPGGGFGLGYGCVATIGNGARRRRLPSLPQPSNPLDRFIPVARLADMLLDPGGTVDYDGQRLTYPDIRLVYWAGGNPFHHHQDLNRLVEAWQRPETVVVQDPFWTATARHADIVLPATTTLERNDFSGSSADDVVVAMPRILDPVGEARDDHAILAGLAQRLGIEDAFTEGLDETGWLRRLYDGLRREIPEAPPFEVFWQRGRLDFGTDDTGVAEDEIAPHWQVLLGDFRADPAGAALPTPSGRIELFSEAIAGFGYPDCPGHPVWREPAEWLGGPSAARFPFHLISNQPATRLHSQLDHGMTSRESKVAGREPLAMNPDDAAAHGLADGDVVKVFNDRGACLAGLTLDPGIRSGVVRLSTGAWYDPETLGHPGGLERHGNPNVLTRDVGTSRLAQGPTAQTCLVAIDRWDGPVPPLAVDRPPAFRGR